MATRARPATSHPPATVALRAVEAPEVSVLVERARTGDRWAREVLYREHLRDVLRVAGFVLGRSADVEDVVQDAFVQAFERLGDLRDPRTFAGWIARIAVNLARARLRRRRFLSFFGLDAAGEDLEIAQWASSEASPEQRAELARIALALQHAGADARSAWVLREVEGWQLDEVAEALGVSLATAKRRIAEANRAIQRIVAGRGRKGGGR